MKKVLVIAFIGLSQFISAQVTKNLGDFTNVKVYDQINLTLVKSTENKIVIKGSRAEEVELVTKNNDLKIKMKLTEMLNGDNVEATLYYKDINEVEASEGAYVGSSDTFKSTAFEVSAKEGAIIKLILDVKKLTSKASSGGTLELSGKAANHDATLAAGGILKSTNLITAQTDISVNAGGKADINATDLVEAKTRAGGYINIYGKPKQVNKKTVAGGTIDVKE